MNFETLKNNKKTVIIVVAVAVALVGAFAAGRYTLPAKVVEKIVEKVVTKEVVKTVVQTQVVEKKVYVKDVQKDVQTDTVTTKKPDGTVITETKTTDLTKTETEAKDSQASSTQVVKTDVKQQTVDIEKTTTTDAKAQYHLRVDVGAGARFVGELRPVLVLGVGAERRIIGPFFAGLWLQTNLSLPSLGVPPYTVTSGLTLAVEL